jgi:hypothetical protein
VRDLVSETFSVEDLALLGGALGGLAEFLLSAGDFGIDVDAAGDFKEDGGGRGDGEDGTAGGCGVLGADDAEVGEVRALPERDLMEACSSAAVLKVLSS